MQETSESASSVPATVRGETVGEMRTVDDVAVEVSIMVTDEDGVFVCAARAGRICFGNKLV